MQAHHERVEWASLGDQPGGQRAQLTLFGLVLEDANPAERARSRPPSPRR
ncbi:hypothetical protein [Streptomyces sp. LN785]